MKFPPLVLSASIDSGTGKLELTGFAQRSRQSLPAAVVDGDVFYYGITSQAADQWEEGIGRFITGSPHELERLRCIRSNNSDAFCDFQAGQKLISIVSPSILQAAAHLHKFPVRAVATANVSLSSDISDGDTLDGITLATGDRVLLVNQSTGSENGIWEVTAATAVRPADFFTDDSARGTLVTVLEGTAGAGRSWVCTAATGADVIDTDSLTWQRGIADAADAILKDGAIAFTGDQSLGGNKLTDVATPTDAADAATKAYVDAGLAGKANSSHNHATGDITNLAEYIRDTIAATLAAGSNVTITVDDGADTITIAASGGGGGSGDVATDAIWSAKGDLAVGTGDDTAIRLAVGTNGQVLTADSTQTSGVKWATPSGGSGGVSGPVSSTDRALALFDGSGGSTITDAPDWTMSAEGKLTGKATVFPTVTTTDGGTVNFDLNAGNFHAVTLGGDRTLTLSNASVGQRFQIKLKQDATGGRTVSWFPNIAWPGGVIPTLTTFANKTDIFGFECDGIDGESQPTFIGFTHGLNYGEPASSYLIFDSFAGTNGATIDGRTSEVGGAVWTVYPDAAGDIEIQTNAANAVGTDATALIDCGETDVTITAEIIWKESGTGAAGVIVAGTDNANKYTIVANSIGGINIYSDVGGSGSSIASGSYTSGAPGGTLTVTKSGSTITVTFGDGGTSTEFATDHSGTLVGMRIGNGDRIDTFAVVEVV